MTLTEKDIDEIEKIVKEVVDGRVSGLPTKEEFHQRMDEVMGELQAISL